MGHDHHSGNDSKTKFAVIFALLLFFALTVAGQKVFVEGVGMSSLSHGEEAGDDHGSAGEHEQAEEPHKSSSKKKH